MGANTYTVALRRTKHAAPWKHTKASLKCRERPASHIRHHSVSATISHAAARSGRIARQDRHDGVIAGAVITNLYCIATDPAPDRSRPEHRPDHGRPGGQRRAARLRRRPGAAAAAGRPLRPPQAGAGPDRAGLLLRPGGGAGPRHRQPDGRFLRAGRGGCVPQQLVPFAAVMSAPPSADAVGTVVSGIMVGILLGRTISGVIGAPTAGARSTSPRRPS
jgi:hypothetical protein